MNQLLPARELEPGMGLAVARRSFLRKLGDKPTKKTQVEARIPRTNGKGLEERIIDWAQERMYALYDFKKTGEFDGEDIIVATILNVGDEENWADIAERVAEGNTSLHESGAGDLINLQNHIRRGVMLTAGRHLQQGDENQASRPMEVMTNCSTSALSFALLYLALNGSGIGRAYDDDMVLVRWDQAPTCLPVIRANHPDVLSGEIIAPTPEQAKKSLNSEGHTWITVDDSREGWAKALEIWEAMAFDGSYKDTILVMDFSEVRERGAPIGGMQDRPASGPGPLMEAFKKVNMVTQQEDWEPWMQAMVVDHYIAECVLVGGARRVARMATKNWRDKSVIKFIHIKRPEVFNELSGSEITDYIREHGHPGAKYWTSNNSVTVDCDFWRLVRSESPEEGEAELWAHAHAVFDAVTEASYYDETGEPGLINQDKLEGATDHVDVQSAFPTGEFARSSRYQVEESTLDLMKGLCMAFQKSEYKMIVNPCGEIVLSKLGGYCVIGDLAPYHAADYNEIEDAVRHMVRFLMRVNLMDSFYKPEVERTNRIGVSLTGVHEWAYDTFGYGFKDLIDEDKSLVFWLTVAQLRRAVDDEAQKYAKVLGVEVPHTNTTVKPAGSTSKLFGLSEGVHLPSMREFLRNVQFHKSDSKLQQYIDGGYPVQELKIYADHYAVGFPTKPEICQLGMGDKLVTAAEATPEEQYQWLRLLEKYWIEGTDSMGYSRDVSTGNQISYTMKYQPSELSFGDFRETLLNGQSSVRCCSVMPAGDTSAYEYLPEQPVSSEEFAAIVARINTSVEEDVGLEHMACENGACPTDFRA